MRIAAPLRRRPRTRRRDQRVIGHRIELAGGIHAPRNARHAVADAMHDRRDLPQVRDVQLLVSELVTNSVVHGLGRATEKIELNVTLFPHVVRVEVADPAGGFDRAVAPLDPDSAGGRGLLIVDAFASRWGIRAGWPSRVWFEVVRPRRPLLQRR